MQSPIPHDLTIYDDQFDFEKKCICPHQWEISVPQKNCIIWGVVLSYLKSADFTVPGKFEERLNRLTENVFEPEAAKSAILGFNPFFNIHKCFFDENLQNISLSFKKLLSEKRPLGAPKTVSQDMQTISTVLQCNILIVDLGNRKLHLISPGDNCLDVASITLVCREYTTKTQVTMKRFTFALAKDLCWELRVDAFRIILEASEIKSAVEKELQHLTDKKEKRIEFLIVLLKKNLNHEISELYDSPYVAGKLADAGFETDPRVIDADGFSAFYYALQSSEKNLVYVLYRYAANSCYESENTFRDLDPSIISNFSKLKEILSADCTRSNNFETFGDKAEQARLTYRDLQRFNEFLIELSRGIDDIHRRPIDSSMVESSKQRDMILLVLDMYIAYFSVEELDLNNSESELIKNYIQNKTYCDSLDYTVALLFFDNIFLLKGVLKSPGAYLYSEIESSFLLSVITNKYFTFETKKKYENIKMYLEDLGFELDSINFSIIPLIERLNLRENIINFCNILREEELVKDVIIKCIPQQEITEMLRNFSELKDEFLVSRLDHYLRAALEATPKNLKQKVVIQRALQVIGESINVENESFSSIKHLLSACIPDHTLSVLKKTRNTLARLKSFQFPLKFKTEQNDFLFVSIQSEIRTIKEAFGEVFDIQKVRLMEFLIGRGLESVQKFQQSTGFAGTVGDHPLVKPLKEFKEALQKRSSDLIFILVQKRKMELRISVPYIEEFCRIVMGYASKGDEQRILSEIPAQIKVRVESIEKLKLDLEKGADVSLDRFDALFLKRKDKCSIKKIFEKYLEKKKYEAKALKAPENNLKYFLYKVKKSPDPLKILNLIFKKNKVSDSQWRDLNDAICFSDDAKTLLQDLIEISKRPFGDNLVNLLNRIKYLKEIAIDEQDDIRYLWEKAKSSKAKQHLAYKIVQRYFRESTFRASLEMLFFDCVAILEKNVDFKSFWLKTSYLFSGIDLRDPLLESVGSILDPEDFPFELVTKMLQLFDDQECIEALCDLWQKTKNSNDIVEDFAECSVLKERVVRCEIWQEYSKLLVENPRDSKTYNDIVSFLMKVPEPRKQKKKNSSHDKFKKPVERK